MLDRLLDFLKDLPASDGETAPADPADDPRIAAAALMVHVIDADGTRDEAETAKLKAMLSENFGIDGRELDRVVAAGEAADREAVDLYTFTSTLKRSLDADARANFIRILWEMVYADGDAHEVEDNIVWRVAELIGVESRERVTLRQKVRDGQP